MPSWGNGEPFPPDDWRRLALRVLVKRAGGRVKLTEAELVEARDELLVRIDVEKRPERIVVELVGAEGR